MQLLRKNTVLGLFFVVGWICSTSVMDAAAEKATVTDNAGAQVELDREAASQKEIVPVGCTDECCDGGGCACSGCAGSCCCEATCCPKQVKEEVKKHCWLVKPELVCIPGYRFSWSCFGKQKDKPNCGDGCCATKNCPAPKCGRVRCIHVLEKHDYKCEECGYEWEVKCVRTSGKSCSCKKCKCPSCGRHCDE